MFRGFLDEVTLRRIRGWAMDANGNPPELVASINAAPVAHFRPSVYRPDLMNFERKDLGFVIETDRELKPGDIVSVTNLTGDHLGGSPKYLTQVEAGREEKVLCLVSRDLKILEIGPAYNPITPRSGGWNSFSLDHANQQELRDKYRGQQPIELIEPVDYLWEEGPLEGAVPAPEHCTFDAIIASHVIEHFPDPISFFQSASVLLKDTGLISLIVPDKRFMFDVFKPVTLTSDYLQAHYLRRARHSKKTAFDNVAYNAKEKGNITWSMRPVADLGFLGENVLFDAKSAFDQTIEDTPSHYVDFHATIYTPSSFALIILELSQLGVIPFSVERAFPTSECEFYVTLRKGLPEKMDSGRLEEERLRLLKAIVRELAQQATWLVDGEQEGV